MLQTSPSNAFQKLYGNWESIAKNWLEKIKPSEMLKNKPLDFQHFKENLIDSYNAPLFNPSSLDFKPPSSFWELRKITPLASFFIQERLKFNQKFLNNLEVPSPFLKWSSSYHEVDEAPSLKNSQAKVQGQKVHFELPEACFQFDPLNLKKLYHSWTNLLEYEKEMQNLEQSILEFTGLEKKERAGSDHFEIKGYAHNKFRIAVANGMNSTKEKALQLGQFIQEGFNGINVHVLYDGSTGLPADILKWGLNVNETFLTPPVALHIQFIRHHFEHYPEQELLFITHSAGGAALKAALKEISPDLREKIVIMNMGGGAYIPHTLCKNAQNYISSRDFVSFLANILSRRFLIPHPNFSDLLECKFVLLKPEPGSKIVDHGILEPTYYKKLERLMSDYFKKYRA